MGDSTNTGVNIAPKTAAAVGGGSLSIAFVSVLEWILGFWHIGITATAAAGLATIFAGAAAYYAPRSHPQQTTEIKA